MTDHHSEEIECIVNDFLTAGCGEADVDTICTQHPEFASELREILRDALRVRQARERAMQPSSNSEHRDQSEDADSPHPHRQVGKYTLGARIGSGGFGEVYEATAEGRTVAIKILKAEHDERADIIHRFRKEAEILQQLGHPGIVPVYEVGEERERPYIVMKCVQGFDLHRHSRAKPIDAHEAARLIAEAADACDFANRAGIVHRDIKPGNILVEQSGRVMVTDFGLAKRLDSRTELTLSLQRLGTPHYMAPEQADRRLGPITRRCDVYSLGATLYFLLTGRPPFPKEDDTSRDATLVEITCDHPKPIREHNPAVPPSLELICLQCLEKWPGCRPSTAAVLADDLRNFLAGRPVKACLPGRATRFRIWCLRHPLPATVLGIAIAALVTGASLSLYYAAEAASSAAGFRVQSELNAASQAREKVASGERLRREYLADMRDAQAALVRGETPVAIRLLTKYEAARGPDDPRAFEWHYLKQLASSPSPIHIEGDGVIWNRVSLSPSGDRIACMDSQGRLTVFSLPDGSELFAGSTPIIDCAFADATKIVALLASQRGRIVLMDASTGAVQSELVTDRMYPMCMAVSPDGQSCLIGDRAGDLFLWPLDGKDPIDLVQKHKRAGYQRSLDIQHGAVTAATFSPDGRRIAVGYEDGATQIWDTDQIDLATRGPNHRGAIMGLSFSPDGTRVASQSFGQDLFHMRSQLHGHVRLWSAATGEPTGESISPHQAMLATSPEIGSGISFGQLRPYFTPDGSEIITTGPFAAQRWSVATGRLSGQFTADGALVHAVALSADGAYLASVNQAGVRVWPISESDPPHVLFSEDAGIRAFCGDGQRLIALYEEGAIVSMGESGSHYLRGEKRSAVIWDLAAGEQNRITGLEANLDTVTLIPDAFKCGSTTIGGAAPSGVLATRLRALHDATALAVSGDGEWIAAGGADGTVRLIPTNSSGVPVWIASPHQNDVTALAFSADGTMIASGGMDRRIHVFGRETGEVIATLQGHRREIGGLAFSPDGTRLASGSGLLKVEDMQAGEVRLWDVTAEQVCLELTTGAADIFPGVAWSADSKCLLAAANTLVESQIPPGRVLMWEIMVDEDLP